MRHHSVIAALAALGLALPSPHVLGAQRGPRAAKPTGAEIAMKARAARLDRANAGKGEFQGKPITFTPATLAPRADLAAGQVIGVLENEVAGDETGLPPGKYNVFAARLGDGWHVYAESGGQIVKEALDVRIVRRPGQPADKRPRIRAKGWGVDIDYTPEKTFNPPPVAAISIVGNTAQLLIGEPRQFTVELRDAGGNLLTGRSVTWTSSAPAVASAPSFGVAKGIAGGSATFTATSEGKSASVTLTVPAPRYRIVISPGAGSPGEYTLAAFAKSSFGVVAPVYVDGCYSGGTGCPVPNVAELAFGSSAPAVATITRISSYTYSTSLSTNFRIDPLSEGVTDLTFSARGATTVVHLTVKRATATTLTVTPSALTVIAGQSQQLTATARDLTGAVTAAPVTWTSGATSIADVTASGRVAGVTPGSATITAKADNVVATVPVVVTPVPVASVTLSPAPVTVEENQWAALTATLKDQAGNVLTGRSVIWSVNNLAIAEVTASGRVIGVAPGTAVVIATSEGRSGSASVTVTAPAATSVPTETISFNW